MTVEDEEAIAVMKRLASADNGDPAVVAGESGGVGLAGLIQVASNPQLRQQIGLGRGARVFLINTEGATDSSRYEDLVGLSPLAVSASNALKKGAADNADHQF
jgi:diaminopropionate ammonia-lyase